MCCLFGVLDYNENLTQKQMNKVISILSTACEARGTDATGISYNTETNLSVFKRPLPARYMRYRIPKGVNVVMGHTRMSTQGDEKFNYNNHPFYSRVSNTSFALAHNGVLHNDLILRRTEKLPATNIETDSYVAVQLIEKKGILDFDSLKYMAEQLEGSFTITVLDDQDNLFFVRGDNPMCIYHFKDAGIYIYASTEAILKNALKKMNFKFGRFEKIDLFSGDILKIDKFGQQTKAEFNADKLFTYSYHYMHWYEPKKTEEAEKEYVGMLKNVAASMGYSKEYVDYLLAEGFTTDDVEDVLYCS